MNKHDLADELRQRQYVTGMVERRLIDALSDDDMIDCYVTCSGCGEKQVEGAVLEQVIADARNPDHFLQLCDAAASQRYRRHHRRQGHLRAPAKIKRSRASLN